MCTIYFLYRVDRKKENNTIRHLNCMTNNEIYAGFTSTERVKAHSVMAAILRRTNIESLQSSLYDSLKKRKDFTLLKLVVKDLNLGEKVSILNLEWEAQIEYNNTISTIYISIEKTKDINIYHMSPDRGVSQMLIEESSLRPYFISTKQIFSSEPLISFILQVKVLEALAEDALLVLDFSSNKIFSQGWMNMVCSTKSLPSPRHLYLVNIISNTDANGTTSYWLRTMGLYRCGIPELEIVNIKSNVDELSLLLHAAANRFIANLFAEKQVISIGFDGLDMNLSWMRWEHAISHLAEDAFGGKEYRIETEGTYNKFLDPSGVLFAVEDGVFTSPEIYIKALKEDSLLFIDPLERLRQKSIAQEELTYFMNIYDEYGTKTFEDFPEISYLSPTKSNYNWLFLVRLDPINTVATNYKQTDELWFELLEINGDEIKAKLISTVYWNKEIKKGDVITASLSTQLSSWIIVTPDNTKYTPDNIYLLSPE